LLLFCALYIAKARYVAQVESFLSIWLNVYEKQGERKANIALVRRIQDIRTSEKRFYRKITDIYATSVDYAPTLDVSIGFFKTVQNKMHWAITGQTAAEIVNERADSEKPHMGLTSWRGSKVRK